MDNSSQFLLTIGSILLLGLITSTLARRTSLPRVTLLLLFGVLLGQQALNAIPVVFAERFDLIADMTLLMVGFLLGGKLTKDTLRESTFAVLSISMAGALGTTIIVSLTLIAFGAARDIAVILGCIAAATAPAAILDVVNESKYQGKFSNLLLSVVALDDVWALILFALGLSVVKSMNGVADTTLVIGAFEEIFASVALGALLGFPAAYLTGRIKQGQLILTEALGIVFVCGGVAIWLDISYLIASMVMGMVIANAAKHYESPFQAIEGIESQFMVVFFVLAGASLQIDALKDLGLVGTVYILVRTIGKYIGTYVGAKIGRADKTMRNWMGLAMLPQAGVAIGMALVASNQFPQYRQTLLSVVISSTIFFELIGPIFTRYTLKITRQNQ